MNPLVFLAGIQLFRELFLDDKKEDDKEKNMEAQKFFLTSKGVVGGLLAVVAGVAGVFGYAVNPDFVPQGTELWLAIGSAVGGVVAVWGRAKAQTPLWFVKKGK